MTINIRLTLCVEALDVCNRLQNKVLVQLKSCVAVIGGGPSSPLAGGGPAWIRSTTIDRVSRDGTQIGFWDNKCNQSIKN